MKSVIKFLFFSVIAITLVQCAKTGRPEGGPKDEDAPIFVTANPPYKTINFNKKEVKLYFNEFIKLKDLNKQLVVSPPLKNPLVVTPQGSASKFLKIKILDTLQKNTTYIFNFGNAIEDNNESNTLESFKYVFSTGNYIDSLTTKGSVKEATVNESSKNINVLLYRIDSSYTDSIIYKKKPNYVTSTLDTSNFEFTNLRDGKYIMIALKEKSSDYLFNPKLDKIGFYPDTIALPKDSIIDKPIVLFREVQQYKFRRGKEITKGKIAFGFEGKKDNFKVNLISSVPENFKSISKFEADKDTLNYWFTPIAVDSLNFEVTNANIIDTVTVKLRKKKLDSLQLSSSIKSTLHFRDTFFITSNNPIVKINTSKIQFFNKDTIAVNYKAVKSVKENRISFLFDKKPEEKYTFKAFPNAFIDIFSIKNDTLNYSFKTKEIEDYGRITLNVNNPENKNVIIELLIDKKKSTLVERKFITASETLVFDLLEPKKYIIRAIIDTNKNNVWDTGNYLKRILPEQIIYFENVLELRANYFLNENFSIKK